MPGEIEKLFESLKGISGSGNVLAKYRELLDGGHLALDPGDYAGVGISLASPVAQDLWYLHNHLNLVAIDENADDDRGRAYVEERLAFLEEKLGGIRPLKALLNLSQLEAFPTLSNYWYPARDNWENNGVYFIQQAAFEMALLDEGLRAPSQGPVEDVDSGYVGYMAFPSGQLGVMEVISLFCETDLEVEDFELKDDEKPMFQTPPEMFPPMDGAGENWCFGRHLVAGGHVIPDDMRGAVEVFSRSAEISADFSAETYPDVSPKGWIRVWFRKDGVMPVPGEFVGILCKPVAAPPHLWWFQESSPFLYAGWWAETRHLTGGVITEITQEAARTDSGVGNLYTVRVQGLEIQVNASDFFGYEVGDRVGILKRDMIDSGNDGFAFGFGYQLDICEDEEGAVRDDLVIVPVEFYKENGDA